ncbi:MAG: hypothetical protein L6Q37_06705 [Bdellovibrionaceae bacterium]|nr:hypothetical protein [Pseudobdellovibrionaceae bacterium]NUM58640.1 hypothetical protein [Pseudobdellovibrionaceae bacterium]
MKKITFFLFFCSIIVFSKEYCENNLRYDYVWNADKSECYPRLNLKYQLAIQMTPRGIEIINRKSVSFKPYEVRIKDMMISEQAQSKKINLFSNGGVFLFTPSQDISKKKVEKVVFENKEENLDDYNWYQDIHGVNEVKSPYELEVKTISCLNGKSQPIKRFHITNKAQLVSYAIDPDYYFRSGVYNIVTKEQCLGLNKEKTNKETRGSNPENKSSQR